MSSNDPAIETMLELASGIVAASQGKVGVTKAMELMGFKSDHHKNTTFYQRIRRRAAKLSVVEKTPPIPAAEVNMGGSGSQVSALTLDEHNPNCRRCSVSAKERSSRAVRRRIMQETPPATIRREGETTASSNSSSAVTTNTTSDKSVTSKETDSKKSRCTSQELQHKNAILVIKSQREKEAMKQATQLIKANNELPKGDPNRTTNRLIIEKVNERMNSNISESTASRYVRKGLINMSPLKRGPVGPFPKRIYNALKGAFSTYLKLEQAQSKKQSTLKQMSKLVNACVNKAGHNKTRDDLTRKLKKDTADQFMVGKANVVEARHLMWTTHYNIDKWFDTWKETLLELGFAREKRDDDPPETEGEIVFFEGQERRILNFDETDASLDDTKHSKGGRPPMTFLAPNIAGGGTSVNKSGYSITIICGSNSAGEPLPPHFQLKTLAQTAEKERFSVDWIGNSKDVVAQFGWNRKRKVPC